MLSITKKRFLKIFWKIFLQKYLHIRKYYHIFYDFKNKRENNKPGVNY